MVRPVGRQPPPPLGGDVAIDRGGRIGNDRIGLHALFDDPQRIVVGILTVIAAVARHEQQRVGQLQAGRSEAGIQCYCLAELADSPLESG